MSLSCCVFLLFLTLYVPDSGFSTPGPRCLALRSPGAILGAWAHGAARNSPSQSGSSLLHSSQRLFQFFTVSFKPLLSPPTYSQEMTFLLLLELKKNRNQQAGISSTSCLPPMNEAAPTPILSCIELPVEEWTLFLPQDLSLSPWASWDPVPLVLSCPTSSFCFLSSSPQPSSGGPLHFQAHLHCFGW